MVVSGIIRTVVGSGSQGFSGNGGPALEASLLMPMRLALDRHGNLYVSQIPHDRVRVVYAASNGTVGPQPSLLAPTPTPTPSAPTATPTPAGPTPTPVGEETALEEFNTIAAAVQEMMADNELDSLPNPVAEAAPACAKGTNRLDAFPDSSVVESGDKKLDPTGTPFVDGVDPLGDKDGYVLFQHDRTADNFQDPLVQYLAMQTSILCYTASADGTIQQFTRAGEHLR